MSDPSSSLVGLQTRVRRLNEAAAPVLAKSILYIMARDCRVADNHALTVAQQQALEQKLPLIVAFVAHDKQVGQRAQEHIRFLLHGLTDVEQALQCQNISFVLRTGRALEQWRQLVQDVMPAAVYFDFSPLRHSLSAKQRFAEQANVPMYVVDTHNVVPVWAASDKQEVGARTLRPKIHRLLPDYLELQPAISQHPYTFKAQLASDALPEVIKRVCAQYPANGTDISRFAPGEKAAQAALETFMHERLHGYADHRNDPSQDGLSELSPYLHYGQLSSLQVVSAVYVAKQHQPELQPAIDTLVEEMVVRKELADNFCYYNQQYNTLSGAPNWAQATLKKHAGDTREFSYTRVQFERAETHDAAWNAAQRQLTGTGKIHGYMRMYWAKKVLEWSSSPEEALQTLLYLNDFYHLDGGDPNGYVGILWSIAGLHDRPWGERPVYGVVRSMVYIGLKRKFDIQAYIDKYAR